MATTIMINCIYFIAKLKTVQAQTQIEENSILWKLNKVLRINFPLYSALLYSTTSLNFLHSLPCAINTSIFFYLSKVVVLYYLSNAKSVSESVSQSVKQCTFTIKIKE